MEQSETPKPTSKKDLLAALRQTKQFVRACLLAADLYEKEAARVQAECKRTGRKADWQFWLDAAADAQRAAAIYRSAMNQAKLRAVQQLRAEGLEAFAEALISGDFAKHLAI